MPPHIRPALLAGLLVLAGASATAGENDGQPLLEIQIKAAYLYKFAGHIEWPPEAFTDTSTPFIIGVVGAGEVADELNRLKPGRAVNDRPVEVRVLKAGDAARGVQLIFVGGRDGAQLKRALEPYKALPALLISDVPGAMDAGSVINFVLVDNRVRFEISVGNAERHGLKVSSRLLAVAQRVDSGRP
jgi:hypothetical protein